MSTDLLTAPAAPEPMTARVRVSFGAGLVRLCIAISSAVALRASPAQRDQAAAAGACSPTARRPRPSTRME